MTEICAKFNWWVLLLHLFFTGCVLNAAQYYVSPTGSDEADGGINAPWRTVTRAAFDLQPGDELIIRGGTFTDAVLLIGLSGDYGRPVVIRAAQGERVVFDLSGAGTYGILLKHCSRVVLRGLEVIGPRSTPAILLDHSSYCAVEGNVVHDGGTQGIRLVSSDLNTVRGNVCYHNDTGIYIGLDASHNLIEANVCAFGNKTSEGADGIGGSDSEQNIFRYNLLVGNNDDGVDVWTHIHCLFEYNLAAYNGDGKDGDGNGYKLGGHWRRPSPASMRWRGGGHTVRYNLAFKNLKTGFTDNNSDGNRYEGNVSYDNVEHVENDGDASVLHTDPANGEWIFDKIREAYAEIFADGLIRPDVNPLPEEFEKIRALNVWPEEY